MGFLEQKYLTWFKHLLIGYGSRTNKGVYRVNKLATGRGLYNTVRGNVRNFVIERYSSVFILSYYTYIDVLASGSSTMSPI